MAATRKMWTFLSTLPARGATSVPGDRHLRGPISIHAPREGSDLRRPGVKLGLAVFLSTLPARGATLGVPIRPVTAQFLSTLPARGATGR